MARSGVRPVVRKLFGSCPPILNSANSKLCGPPSNFLLRPQALLRGEGRTNPENSITIFFFLKILIAFFLLSGWRGASPCTLNIILLYCLYSVLPLRSTWSLGLVSFWTAGVAFSGVPGWFSGFLNSTCTVTSVP